ncbi:ABC transporter substrate-binding protein [Paenibacillus allorhizosphaerae]|uniref:Extracellular solute-binding protein n=1 Tax=Paenibacillus allorhizosphaerae TaxID=2849866 RepID=A0ABN7TVQ0_9BACL|nr:extracellular solute-binding protein [Paenibacillus allorhizosphaerae]CAG7657624.1 hypothetical protein PAECIP111802_06792 [Paenibacillus allorhizosphaerae]
MEINRKRTFGLLTSAAALILVTACNGEGTAPAAETAKSVVNDTKESAELLVLSKVPSITQDEFDRTIAAPIQAKYPNYKVKYIIDGKETTLDKMMVAGQAPDITLTSIGGMYSSLIPLSLEYDLTELIKKYNFNLNRIEPSTIESLKNATSKGAIYGLPKYTNGVVLFYNKDIFKKFGVPFPTDGMTWDEVLKLATTMTRVDNGTQYRGMGFFYSNMLTENQLSAPFLNPREDKSAVNGPLFQRLLQTYKSFYDIPGNKPTEDLNADKELTAFQKNRNMAMVMAPLSGYGRFESDPDLDWDVVSAPTFSDQPKVGYQPNTIYYFISNVNKQADQAFKAVVELLSDDVQLQANKEARPTVLNDEKIRATLGSNHKLFKDKNFKALYYNKFAPIPPANEKLAPLVNAASVVQSEFAAMIKNGTDVNTALRQADEKINQAITTAKNK